MKNVELPLLKETSDRKTIPRVVLVGLVVLVILFILAVFSITFKNTYMLHYSEASTLDYNVFLEDNDFFEEKYLPKDKQYISSLIDYVDADLNYDFFSEEDIGLKYSYYVVASVLVDNSNGKNLYKKDDVLVDKQEVKKETTNLFGIKENVKFEYDKYNDIASKFIEKYNLTTASAKLVVSMYVDVEGQHTDFEKKIQDKSVVSLTIPLTQVTTDIEISYDLTNNKNEVLQYKEAIISNPLLFNTSVILAVLDFIIVIILVIYIVKTRDSKAKYQAKLNRILKTYKDYMCETNITQRAEDMEKTRDFKLISLSSFDGIIEIADKIKKPILYHEERVGEKSIFYMYDNNIVYIYTMEIDDFK